MGVEERKIIQCCFSTVVYLCLCVVHIYNILCLCVVLGSISLRYSADTDLWPRQSYTSIVYGDYTSVQYTVMTADILYIKHAWL